MKGFCKAAFRSVYFNGQKMRPCCWYDQTQLEKRARSLPEIQDFFGGAEVETIQRRMIEGEQLEGCKRCWSHESIGGKSHRDFWNERSFENEPESSVPSLKALDLYMGNLCNLKCVTCSSFNSSSWIKDEVKLEGKAKLDRVENVDLAKIPEAVLDTVEWIKFAGGEVLLMNTHLEFLEKLVERGRAPNISLNYVTNATICTDRILALWKKFKKVRLILSIDGVDEVFEYARFPASWRNVKEVVGKMMTLSNAEFEINTVVSILNVFHLKEILQWRDGSLPEAPIFFRILDAPDMLAIDCLPETARAQAFSLIEGVSELSHVANKLKVSEHKGFERSKQWLNKLDQVRGNSFEDINPWAKNL
ncbi:MAG: radical SAM protein [Bdellovibrionales bacterium]|nr:radical SAM protein [Bdellovibrionales bacterium]